MELRHLNAFVVLAEELHFGRAAERLGMAQPALSLQIQSLEASLGLKLFDRTRRRVALTEGGELFLPEARATVIQAERARRTAVRAGRGELGRLEIGFTGSAPFSTVMPRIISHFRRAWPDVRLSLRELSTAVQFAELADGTLDVGFVRPSRSGDHKNIVLQMVLDEPLLAVLAADHPLAGRASLSVAELAGQPFILHPRHVGTGLFDKVVELCRTSGFTPDVTLEAHQMPTIVGLAAAGVGVSIVPEGMRHIEVEGVRFVRLNETAAHMALMTAHRADDERQAVKRFVAIAVTHAIP